MTASEIFGHAAISIVAHSSIQSEDGRTSGLNEGGRVIGLQDAHANRLIFPRLKREAGTRHGERMCGTRFDPQGEFLRGAHYRKQLP